MIFILLVIKLKSNAILTGIAFNIIAAGGTVFMLWLITGDKGASTSLDSLVAPQVEIPFLKNIPYVGTALSNHSILTYIALISMIAMHILIYKTSLCLKIRAVGEDEDTAKSVGINVNKIKIISLTISGALAGLGGAFMSMSYLSWFSTGMTAGRGFIGLAAEATGNGTPLGGTLISFLFGYADAFAIYLQTKTDISSEIVRMLPYISTIVGFGISNYYRNKKKGYQRMIKADIEMLKKLEIKEGIIDVVIDTDTYNEIDDQFAIVYAMESKERFNIKAIYTAPFYKPEYNLKSSSPKDGLDKSYVECKKLLKLMKIEDENLLYKGSTRFITAEGKYEKSDSVENLINLVMNN